MKIEDDDPFKDQFDNDLMAFNDHKQIFSPSELFSFFKNKTNADIEYKIVKDLNRTVLGKSEFKIDHKTGKNELFNVLNAYAMYDPEISYC